MKKHSEIVKDIEPEVVENDSISTENCCD